MLRVVTTSDVSEKPPPSSQLASPEPLLPWAEYVGQAVGLSQKLLDPKRPFELELVAWLWRALVVALEFLHRHHSRAEQRYLRQLIRKALSGTGKLVLSCLLVAS
jgi:hypothetical protein